MSLLATLRKKRAERVATATVATVATQGREVGRTVASVATAAVASSPEPIAESPATVGAWLSEIPATTSPEDERISQVVAKLESDPALNYALETHDEIDPDAVILTLAIRGKGAGELRIPKSRYDAFALLELIERHTTRETLQ